MTKKLQALGVALGLLAMLALSGFSQLPTWTLFELGAGVRALGMGEAFAALADDEQALYYNPAGLAFLEDLRVSAFYESHFASSDYLSAAFGMRRLGVGLSLFNFGSVEQRDANDQPQGSFSHLQLALMGATGVSLSELPWVGSRTRGLQGFSAGLRAKVLFVSTLGPASGAGFGLDPSFLMSLPEVKLAGFRLEALRAGLTMENLLSTGTLSASGRREGWPIRLRLGSAVLMPRLAIGLDLAVPFEFHLGGEVRLRPLAEMGDLAIRLGGMVREGLLSITLGLGLTVQDFQIDYAFVSHPELPGSHRLSLSWRL